EAVHLGEAAQHLLLLLRRQRTRELLLGEELAEPHPLLLGAEVSHLDREVTRVPQLEALGDVLRGREVREAERRTGHRLEVRVADAVEFRRQLLRARRRTAERIELDGE